MRERERKDRMALTCRLVSGYTSELIVPLTDPGAVV